MHLTASIALALSVALGSNTPAPEPQPAPIVVAPAQTVRQYVAKYFADIPIMVKIANCESHYRQYSTSGAAFRGEQNHQDVGVMQINEYYHLKRSKELGIDIYTVEGNMEYARYLYEHEGTTPWLSSSFCWDRANHVPLATAAK